jgi:hypothetical protein
MTVGKLQEELSKHPADTKVVVHWEDGQPHQCFGIDDVSLHTGTPCRDSKHRAGFTFDGTGPARWLFISISPE